MSADAAAHALAETVGDAETDTAAGSVVVVAAAAAGTEYAAVENATAAAVAADTAKVAVSAAFVALHAAVAAVLQSQRCRHHPCQTSLRRQMHRFRHHLPHLHPQLPRHHLHHPDAFAVVDAVASSLTRPDSAECARAMQKVTDSCENTGAANDEVAAPQAMKQMIQERTMQPAAGLIA